jgi:hypothetical protein
MAADVTHLVACRFFWAGVSGLCIFVVIPTIYGRLFRGK